MTSTIFFSYSETDKAMIDRIVRHAHDPDYDSLKFRVAERFERWDTKNISVMQNFILKSLKGSVKIIVFVGDDTYESLWVPLEVELAIEFGIPVYAIRLKGSEAPPPGCLLEHNIKVEDWNVEILQYLATR